MIVFDSEFTGLYNEILTPICSSASDPVTGKVVTHWTFKDKDGKAKDKARYLDLIAKDEVFVSYHVPAEARYMISLGINPLKARWIDLKVEWLHILYNNDVESTGQHLKKDGTPHEVRVAPPKWDREEGEDSKYGQVNKSLAGACFRLLNVKIDTDHKTKMRDLCIRGTTFSAKEKKAVMDYCESDVENLTELFFTMVKVYKRLLGKDFDLAEMRAEMLARGHHACRAAIIETTGYCINIQQTRNFSGSTGLILKVAQHNLNKEFDVKPFEWDAKKSRFVQKKAKLQSWVESLGLDGWLKTDKGEIALSLDAFRKFFNTRGSTFGDSFTRFLSTKTAMNGFLPGARKSIWKSQGSDGRIRPSLGIFGSQTSRSQPSSGDHMFLKSKWMRCFVQPPKGKVYIAIDYSSEEFLITGLLCKCQAMIDAYQTDVYLGTAIISGLAPANATKESHRDIRDMMKPVVLGISYGMQALSLSIRMTKATGKIFTEEDAQDIIDRWNRAYPEWEQWRGEILELYEQAGYLKSFDGWYLWGDNPSPLSVLNFPVQTAGGDILRRAIVLTQDAGLTISVTLHDALYILADQEDAAEAVDTLNRCMVQAFQDYFIGHTMHSKAVCRTEAKVWGPGMEGVIIETEAGPITATELCIEDQKSYDTYKKYFLEDQKQGLLSLF